MKHLDSLQTPEAQPGPVAVDREQTDNLVGVQGQTDLVCGSMNSCVTLCFIWS